MKKVHASSEFVDLYTFYQDAAYLFVSRIRSSNICTVAYPEILDSSENLF